jgi:hypothetical protein
MTYFEDLQKQGRKALVTQKEKKLPDAKQKSSRAKALEPRVREVLAAQDELGRWISKSRSRRSDWQSGELLETSVFIRNIETLAEYLETLP